MHGQDLAIEFFQRRFKLVVLGDFAFRLRGQRGAACFDDRYHRKIASILISCVPFVPAVR